MTAVKEFAEGPGHGTVTGRDAVAGPSGCFEFDALGDYTGMRVLAGVDELDFPWAIAYRAIQYQPADLTQDGKVDGADLGLLLAQFGSEGSADFDGNGVVDGGDLGALLAAWTG